MKRGQPITFRIPSDTPDHILKQLQQLREVEKRNFSSKIASFVIQGVSELLTKQRETITIPLPKRLTKEQHDWLKHEHSEAMLGSIVYQLLSDPIRTASLFASLNSSALDIDEALYLQEEEKGVQQTISKQVATEPTVVTPPLPSSDDDLDALDWEQLKVEQTPSEEKKEEKGDPLADFLAQMNK